jgi:hypothetical protein
VSEPFEIINETASMMEGLRNGEPITKEAAGVLLDKIATLRSYTFKAVRMDFYNELRDAADVGFVKLVEVRDGLNQLHADLQQYPERDSRKIEKASFAAVLGDDIELSRDDIAMLKRRYDDRIERLALALNEGLHKPRYS